VLAALITAAATWYAAQARHTESTGSVSNFSSLIAPQHVGSGAGIADGHLLREPQEGSHPLVRVLDKAQQTIFLECYILTDVPIIHALERAATQGVQVYVLLEPHALGMGTQPQQIFEQLRDAGVSVRWAPRPFALTHAKFIVADDHTAIVSTANMSRSAFKANREFLLVTADRRLVHQLSALFRDDWDGLPVTIEDPNAVIAPQDARPSIVRLITLARRSLDIYAEEMSDPRIERLLAQKARRHVRVEILLAAGQTPTARALLQRYGVLLRTRHSPYIHAKVIVADGREGYLGSENLSAQSLDTNREVGVLVRGALTRALQIAFQADWKRST
jgi:phosphatidylserine/phosphatidylglycerophosphate/cardiolipin synthase-like enzyme